MPNNTPKNILIAPLDWGAGHTTRCIPIIRYLLSEGHNVFAAGNSSQQIILAEVFGNKIQLLSLEGYNITYSPLNKFAQAGLLLQMPRVVQVIKQEHQWLQRVAKEYKIDAVISDNRYGLYQPNIPCVIMTHQLRVLSGMGNLADNVVQRLHYHYLNRFSATWIVDVAGEESLAGKLSHTTPLPDNARYIGLLSRFANNGFDYHSPSADTLLMLLSGPEPQRSILSRILWQEAVQHSGKIFFAEGNDNTNAPTEIPQHIQYHKRLGGEALQNAISHAKMVICRSGYSTLMDLAATGKKAILIPTPGQTEQEYLGKMMHEKGLYYTMPQSKFNLGQAIAEVEKTALPLKTNAGAFNKHRHVLQEWLKDI